MYIVYINRYILPKKLISLINLFIWLGFEKKIEYITDIEFIVALFIIRDGYQVLDKKKKKKKEIVL